MDPHRSPRDSTPPVTGSVAVLIPALNEEETLPGVLADLRTRSVGPVVVVDNGSTDRTSDIAVRGGAYLVTEPRRGYGATCLAGIDFLRSMPSPPTVLVFLDADHAEGPAQIDRISDPVLRGEADLALGVRQRGGGRVGTLFPHARLGNRLVLLLTRLLFGRSFRDLPPFRAISVRKLEELKMSDRSWGWTLQMQVRAIRCGFRIAEIEVAHGPRSGGKSKISGTILGTARAGSKMLFTLLRERLTRHP